MSVFIKREDAITAIAEHLMGEAIIDYYPLASDDIEDYKPIAFAILESLDSIEIILCEKCRYWQKGDRCKDYCEKADTSMGPDDFCSKAHRPESRE